jgi:carbonyl reductase 1
MMSQRIALITGGNKGIGKEIARKLGQPNNDMLTIIGCRNKDLGSAAAEELRGEGCNVIFKQLDICETSSIKAVCDSISDEFGHLDILVNNAGIAFKGSDNTPFQEQSAPTVNLNFFGTLNVIKIFLPLLKKSTSPRIINVASQSGHLKIMPTRERKAMFTSSKLTLGEFVDTYIHMYEYELILMCIYIRKYIYGYVNVYFA